MNERCNIDYQMVFRYTDPGSSLGQTQEGDLETYFKGSSSYFTQGLQYSGAQTGETCLSEPISKSAHLQTN